MIRPLASLPLALLLALAAWPAPASAITAGDPRLGFRRLAGAVPSGPVLAQRAIDRNWGPSDDSIYVEVELPGWKSEPLAAALSATLPGAGQAYVGESNAWVYTALEVAGWGGWWWYRRDAGQLRDRAAGVADAEELRATARRIVLAKRMFNLREGWKPADDWLPDRFLSEPLELSSGRSAALSPERLRSMIDAYYEERGLDAAGLPGSGQLADMELDVFVY